MCDLALVEYFPRQEPFASVIGDAQLTSGKEVFLRAFRQQDPQGMLEQANLYRSLGTLIARHTPHIAQLVSEQVCNGDAFRQALISAAALGQEQNVAKQLEIVQAQDQILALLIESSRINLYGVSLPEPIWLEVIFQVVWSLHVFGSLGVRHGDLHLGQILLYDHSAEPVQLAYVPDPSSDLFFQLNAQLFVKIAHWLWGGIYKPSKESGLPAIDTGYPGECNDYSHCGRNTKIDLHRFLHSLSDINFAAYGYAEVAELIAFAVPDVLLQEQYLCAGKFEESCSSYETCTDCKIELGEDCRAPWEPSDCLIKTPLEVLNHPVFQRFQRKRGQTQPQGKIYGLWKTDQQADRWLQQKKIKPLTVVRAPKAQKAQPRPRPARFPVPPAVEEPPEPGQPAQFAAPLVQEKFCTKKRNKEVEQQRYTIKELRQLGKERKIPKAFHMSYEQLCQELGFQVD